MGAKNQKFKYQLTQWLPRKCDLKFAINQIEVHEPNSEGIYYVIKKNKTGDVAVFTRGLSINTAYTPKGTYDKARYGRRKNLKKRKDCRR